MEVIQQLIGRLHPVVVHLPIGFIITGLLLQWFDRKKREWSRIIAMVFLWGFISAAVACISGYLLYVSEGYSFETVKFHLWLGITTSIFSLLMHLRLVTVPKVAFLKQLPVVLLSFSLLFLISFTGHLGGNITHGADYLLEPLPNNVKTFLGMGQKSYENPTLDEENWEEAVLYTDLVQPILNSKCVSCHNAKKNKGELQLQEGQGILKGGENGDVIEPNDPSNSPLYARLILPLDHEDHMPPKDKTQITKDEIEIIKTWIANGNDFDKKIGELELNKELFTSFFPKTNESLYPKIEVAAASMDSIAVLKKKGLHIEPISADNNFLKVSTINKPMFGNKDMESLAPILNQTAYLDLGGTKVTDEVFDSLSLFPNLTVLKLDNTEITGKNIKQLERLENLKSLNLVRTNFEEAHLAAIKEFKNLQTVYLYHTRVVKPDTLQKRKNGELFLDYGGYILPKIETDTIVY
ncbi:hypothetical protein KCTC52924_01398 [Arenibacter antarcticus]|uniref:C-type cytochrome domain-containing protein n=1 Tax=Arenibacter antarcticus TaxID=2040469 RepID=A0ABW5V9W8_9FLAO|nr:c-type cytochrome domain-containing protein [Arenibacter sp. H213]MCM4167797.1 hypothetical protein [Arenibacter sp. H213]